MFLLFFPFCSGKEKDWWILLIPVFTSSPSSPFLCSHGTHLYPSHCLRSNRVGASHKSCSQCNMTQEVCCGVCVFTRHLCVELYFHRQDVCMFQTPFLCGPEGFGSVWVEVRELEYVCMMCVCRVMENWWYMKDGDSQMGSREYKGKKSWEYIESVYAHTMLPTYLQTIGHGKKVPLIFR